MKAAYELDESECLRMRLITKDVWEEVRRERHMDMEEDRVRGTSR